MSEKSIGLVYLHDIGWEWEVMGDSGNFGLSHWELRKAVVTVVLLGEKKKLCFGHLRFEMPVGTSKWKYISFSILPVPVKQFSYLLRKRKGIHFEMKLNQITSPFNL